MTRTGAAAAPLPLSALRPRFTAVLLPLAALALPRHPIP